MRALTAIALAATVSPTSAAPAPAAEVDNLLANPGFEQVEADKPVGWQVNAGYPCRVTVVDDPTQAHSGRRAIKLVMTNTDPRAGGHYVGGSLSPKEGTLYTVSVWARGRGMLQLFLYAYDDKAFCGGACSGANKLSDQWKRFGLHWSKGPEDAKVRKVTFALSLSETGSYMWADDASILASPFPKPTNLIPNGDFERDADGNGVADGWHGGKLEKGRDGGRAHRCDVARPTGRSDQSTEPEKWWSWDQGRFVMPGWACPIISDPFPVKESMRYAVRLRIQARRVRSEHVCVWWLDENQRGLGRPNLGGLHGGSWPWQELVADVSSPPRARFAKLGVMAKAGGGTIWLDSAAMVPAPGSPARWRLKSKRTTVPGAKPLPDDTQSAKQLRPITRLAASGPTENTAQRVSDGVKITLTGGVALFMAVDGNAVRGITEARYRNLLLRNPDAPPVAPLVELSSGNALRSCRVIDAEADARGVVVRTRLEGEATVDLEWVFEPYRDQIGDRQYVGFGYGYRFRCKDDEVPRLCDRSTWELGGLSLGNTVIDPQTYEVDHVFPIDRTSTYCTRNAQRFVFAEAFDYQTGPEGSLVCWFEHPAHIQAERAGTSRFIMYQDTCRFPTVAAGRTPLKYVLYSPGNGGLDEWARVRDHVFERYRDHYGIIEHDPMPLALGGLKKKPREVKTPCRWWADNAVPEVAKLGFKYLRAVGISTKTYDLSDTDTPENRAYLQQQCQQHGVGLVAWQPTVHLSRYSPYWAEHPEWEIEGRDGKPATGYCYPDIRGVDLSTFTQFGLSQLAKLRQRPGLVGLWMDSYCNFTHGIQPADYNFGLRQAQNLFKYHAAIQKLGYVTYCEASPCFGIKSPGFPTQNADSPSPRFPRPETLYKTSQHVGSSEVTMRHLASGNTYYRHLANKSVPWMVLHLIADDPAALKRIAQANRDYVTALPDMKIRTLLPDDRGVEWANPETATRVLFSYRNSRYARPSLREAHCLTTGKPVMVENGSFTARPSHTYRVTARR